MGHEREETDSPRQDRQGTRPGNSGACENGRLTGLEPPVGTPEYGLKDLSLQSLAAFLMFQFPGLIIRAVLRRLTLIVWWSGAWVNQGINIFQVENSWTELESANNQLAQERENLERQVTRLSAVITRKDEELSKERGLRKRLLSRWARDEGRQSEHNAAIGQMTRSLLALDSCVTSLDRDVCALKEIFGDGHERSDGQLDSTPNGEAIPTCRSHCACVASPGPDDVTQSRRPREPKHQNLATVSADRLGSKDKKRCGIWRLFLWCCLLCSFLVVLAHPFTSKYFFNPAWRFTNINSGSSWVGSFLARMRKLLEFLYLTNTS